MRIILASICLLLGSMELSAQQTKIFSLSPLSKTTTQVNGMVLGIGHFPKSDQIQRINGVNVDVLPLSLVFLGFADGPHPATRKEPTRLITNGLNVALGGYYRGMINNGVMITLYNLGKETNGLSINGTYVDVERLHGLHISGIGNFSDYAAGVNIGFANNNVQMKGVQIGIFNTSQKLTGIQIGFFNSTKSLQGLQLGLWNKNGRRTLPLINF
ncbi:hypothetical protein LZQ00_06210 [Sphingobacterium sp. SRCM116780]|uniref:LA_2272 family surface repeat-containing protein n=1 Tax=Sphingobacterium sp. SRCM116780 TaxID=2907623 RepID=UPI001F336DD6|nr:hypothetical protein [Sphingobacterium sp. SRCM116780]UIR57407.1 hypothetical protein LZQ00_06210 [Sphingobacterium sp. SRCM116780]